MIFLKNLYRFVLVLVKAFLFFTMSIPFIVFWAIVWVLRKVEERLGMLLTKNTIRDNKMGILASKIGLWLLLIPYVVFKGLKTGNLALIEKLFPVKEKVTIN